MRGSAPGSNIRWREDVFEARCPDCHRRGGQSYWPVTLEFWDPSRPSPNGGQMGRSMARCRACWKAMDARNRRRRHRLDPVPANLRAARYRAECGAAINIAQRARRAGRVA